MPILNPSQVTSAELLGLSESTLRFLSAAASALNAMSNKLLSLDNDDLQTWLNSQPIDDISALFSAHASTGAAINSAAATTSQQVIESGVAGNYTEVDVRPFQEKLAEQFREVTYDGTKWVVSSLQTTDPVIPVAE